MRNTICKPISIFLMVFLILAPGCGQNAPKVESSPPPVLAGKSLKVVTSYGPNNGAHKVFESLCDEFQSMTGAEIVNDSEDSTEEWKQSVRAMFASEDEPDVLFFFTGPDVESLIQNEEFVPFDEIRQEYPDYASNINLMVLESLRTSDGKDYAVPIKGYWERLFVNADIFNDLDLELPTTYDDLFTIAPILLDAGYIPISASLSEVPHYLFEAFLYNETGPSNHHNIPSDPDNLPVAWVTALSRFQEAYSAGLFPDESIAPTHADAFELFQSKKAAMIVDGDWSVAFVRDTENVIVIDFPSNENPSRKSTDLISGFSMGFYISRSAWDNADKRNAAAMFVQFVTSNSSIIRLNVSGAAMPISIEPSNDIQNDDDADITPLLRSINSLNKKTTAFVGAVADEFSTNARAWLFERILPLSKGELDPHELLKEFIIINTGL